MTTVIKRDPIVVKIRVKYQDHPNSSECILCEGKLELKFIDFPRNVAYDEGWVTILLVGLPALVCSDCKCEWVLNRIVKALDGTVERALKAVDEGSDLKKAHLSTVAGEFIGTETPVLCTKCRYGYGLPINETSKIFKCLSCEAEFKERK